MGKVKDLIQRRGFRSLLIAQFLGTYIDHAYWMLVSLLLVSLAGKAVEAGSYLSAASGLFIIPFILFSPYAGVVADRFSKRSVLIVSKMMEVGVMILGLLGFIILNVWFILFCLFCMGIQSVFHSPAKYGILPEMLMEKDLSCANGLIEMTTFLAIILGVGSAGIFLFLFHDALYRASAVFIVLGLGGVAISWYIDAVPPSHRDREFELNVFNKVIRDLKRIRKDHPLWLAILAIVYFWFIGAIVYLVIILYGKELMGLNNSQISFLWLLLALGVGLGSLLAGKLSGDRLELGLVPVGSLGMGLFILDLFFAYPSPVRTGVDLILLGLSGGLFMVPLNAFIQQRSPREAKGQTIATANILTFTGVLGASFILYFLNVVRKLPPDEIFLILAILAFGVSAYLIKTFPVLILRFLLWLLLHIFYRIEVVGAKNVPLKGPALLICNHISYVDPLLLGASIPRLIRFVMFKEYYEIKGLNWFFRLFKAIPVSEEQGPKELLRSLRWAQKELKEGHLVCIFAEGAISRTGSLLSFKKGLTRISRDSQVPIIPVHLDNVWGSIFSFKKKRFFFKFPERIPRAVTVSLGKPLVSDAPIHKVRRVVMELGALSFSRRKEINTSLPSRFVEISKKYWFRTCMADSSGKSFSYGKSLAGSLILARLIRERVEGDKVGVLLPPSTVATLANIAIVLAGKVSVNLNYALSEESVTSMVQDHGIARILASRLFLEKIKFRESPKMIFLEDWLKEIDGLTRIREYLKAFIFPAGWLKRNLNLSNLSHKVSTIIFSSGSTGVPKGVMLSHQNILSNIAGIQQVFHLTSKDCIIGCLPFFHSLGFTGTLWLPLLSRLRVVYHPNPLESRKIGELVQSYRATLIIGAPTFYQGYMRRGRREQWSSMRYAVAGAEKLPRELFDAFKRELGIIILEGYGCTELSPVVSVNVPDFENNRRTSQKGMKVGSVGRPLPGVAVKVVNPDNFLEVSSEEEGLLLVKGANVMIGYLNQREETEKVVRDGWYVTGDIGRVDEDGFIWITDRLSRFSKIGGEMIPHIRIEKAIQEVLQAKELACTVISLPDQKKGERLAVVHKRIEMEIDEIVGRLKDSGLPPLWIPKKSHFYEMGEIPILGSGKIDFRKIRNFVQNYLREVKYDSGD